MAEQETLGGFGLTSEGAMEGKAAMTQQQGPEQMDDGLPGPSLLDAQKDSQGNRSDGQDSIRGRIDDHEAGTKAHRDRETDTKYGREDSGRTADDSADDGQWEGSATMGLTSGAPTDSLPSAATGNERLLRFDNAPWPFTAKLVSFAGPSTTCWRIDVTALSTRTGPFTLGGPQDPLTMTLFMEVDAATSFGVDPRLRTPKPWCSDWSCLSVQKMEERFDSAMRVLNRTDTDGQLTGPEDAGTPADRNFIQSLKIFGSTYITWKDAINQDPGQNPYSRFHEFRARLLTPSRISREWRKYRFERAVKHTLLPLTLGNLASAVREDEDPNYYREDPSQSQSHSRSCTLTMPCFW